MNQTRSNPISLPARSTSTQLAEALGCDVSAVQAALNASGEQHGPDEILDSKTTLAVAKYLGREIQIEPRDLALECLYEFDSNYPELGDRDLPARVERLVSGVSADRENLDHEIESASKHWAIARMPMIDRSILRLGLWELKNDPQTPTGVIVSEAVRLANTYSTTRSGSFVNGVLGALAKSVR